MGKKLIVGMAVFCVALSSHAASSQDEGPGAVTDFLKQEILIKKANACFLQSKIMLAGYAMKEKGVPLEQVIASSNATGEDAERLRAGYGLDGYLDNKVDDYFSQCMGKD